jgi:hypothetical protein
MFTLKKGRGGGIYFLNETSACALKHWTRINSERGLGKISVIETDTATSGPV